MIRVISFNNVEKQAILNNGKGLILCHIRKVTNDTKKISFTTRRKYPTEKVVKTSSLSDNCMERYGGIFMNSKRIMEIIAAHRVQSYAELYVMLFAKVD
jgi:hypothetical protein